MFSCTIEHLIWGRMHSMVQLELADDMKVQVNERHKNPPIKVKPDWGAWVASCKSMQTKHWFLTRQLSDWPRRPAFHHPSPTLPHPQGVMTGGHLKPGSPDRTHADTRAHTLSHMTCRNVGPDVCRRAFFSRTFPTFQSFSEDPDGMEPGWCHHRVSTVRTHACTHTCTRR